MKEKALKKAEYDRKYNYKRYRNTEGLTDTEVARRAEFIKIAELELQGYSYKAIAKELGYTHHNKITRKINKEYKKINYNEIKDMVIELRNKGIKILA